MMLGIDSTTPDPSVVSNIPTPPVREFGRRCADVNPLLIGR
jgi:hypothetical protein